MSWSELDSIWKGSQSSAILVYAIFMPNWFDVVPLFPFSELVLNLVLVFFFFVVVLVKFVVVLVVVFSLAMFHLATDRRGLSAGTQYHPPISREAQPPETFPLWLRGEASNLQVRENGLFVVGEQSFPDAAPCEQAYKNYLWAFMPVPSFSMYTEWKKSPEVYAWVTPNFKITFFVRCSSSLKIYQHHLMLLEFLSAGQFKQDNYV